MVAVRLLGHLNPQALDPLKELVLRFDKFYICLCDNCRNRKTSSFVFYPCMFRKNLAWKVCRYHKPIARNGFLADRVRALTKWLTLDEAIGLFRSELGSVFEPIEERRQD